MPNVEQKRCSWSTSTMRPCWSITIANGGGPNHNDRKHFEFLILEAAQAGLNWSIVLKKREGYRRAFSQFDPEKVARYTKARIDKLTVDPRIIRNRRKIEAAVNYYLVRRFYRLDIWLLTAIAAILVASVVAAQLGIDVAKCLVILILAPAIIVVGYESRGYRLPQGV